MNAAQYSVSYLPITIKNVYKEFWDFITPKFSVYSNIIVPYILTT
jgi:hypothetical protein